MGNSSQRARRVRRLLTLVGCAWVLALTCSAALAEPVVRIRADSRIELGVTHLDVGMSITGALRDELGHGLASRTLALSAIPLDSPDTPFETTVRTNQGGEFSLEIADANHDYRLLASFEGDVGHRGVRVERSVERARADVRLELRVAAGSVLDLDTREVTLAAIAESDAGGADITLRLSDETGAELARAQSNSQGHAHFVVPTERFGPPGTGLLRVESLRDERHAEAQTEARIIRSRKIRVDLQTERGRIEVGNELAIDGSVRTNAGPCPNLPVGLFLGAEHVRTVMTGEDGHFEARLSVEGVPRGTAVSARVEADPSGAHNAAEALRPIAVIAPEPLPLTWVLGLIGGAVALALGVARFRRARHALEHMPTALVAPSGVTRPSEGGARYVLSGVVTDTMGTPIPGARVEITHIQQGLRWEALADARGQFVSPLLRKGILAVRGVAPGYSGAELQFSIPHRGDGEGMTIRLDNLRARVMRAFKAAVEARLPFPKAFSVWTPREIRSFLAQRRPDQRLPLNELSRDVERATYGAAPPTEQEVLLIEERAAALLASAVEPTPLESTATVENSAEPNASAR
ncbi:MAG: hypothetical protein RL385_2674 [Pseudomonadota bacterium]